MAQPITGQAQGLVLSTSQKAGQPAAISTGWHNELVASELLPRYAYLTLSGFVFSVAQAAAAALTAVGTTTTGLTLWNPSSSGKNLILLDCTIGITPLTFATVGVQVMLGGALQPTSPTFGAAQTPLNNLVGSTSASVAKAGTGSSTIANSPVTGMRCVASALDAVLATSGGGSMMAAALKDEIAGAVVVPPGAVITLFGIGTVADASVNAAYTWAELPT